VGETSPAKPSGHAIVFVRVTILVDTIGFGMITPVMPVLIDELTGEGLAEGGALRRNG
jgi:DHA1 family tetracycline resistance protein-like MFS transporter